MGDEENSLSAKFLVFLKLVLCAQEGRIQKECCVVGTTVKRKG